MVSVQSYTSEDEIDSLKDNFAGIKLVEGRKEKLYKILPNTDWKFTNSEYTEQENVTNDKLNLSNLGGLDDVIVELKNIVFKISTTVPTEGEGAVLLFT